MRFLFALLSLFSLSALAQDAGVLPTDDVAVAAQQLITGIQTKNWWLVAGAALIGVVWLVRTQLPKLIPSLQKTLENPIVSVLLPVVLSIGGAIATAALAGPVDAAVILGLLGGALKVSFASISGYVAAKKVKEATALGEAAAAEVKNIADAKAVLAEQPKSGPNP